MVFCFISRRGEGAGDDLFLHLPAGGRVLEMICFSISRRGGGWWRHIPCHHRATPPCPLKPGEPLASPSCTNGRRVATAVKMIPRRHIAFGKNVVCAKTEFYMFRFGAVFIVLSSSGGRSGGFLLPWLFFLVAQRGGLAAPGEAGNGQRGSVGGVYGNRGEQLTSRGGNQIATNKGL